MKETYNPKNIEEPIYEIWEKSGYFEPNLINNNKNNNYCIMMPPPNITGGLHLGHAFQQTIMDILVRYQRMLGKNVLWATGFDHAGIATQILIENNLFNKTHYLNKNNIKDLLLTEIWSWKEYIEQFMSYQIKRLGCSVSWKNKRFTMDPHMSFAVKEAFIRLYNNNLIYKGKRLVNWDYTLKTAISDLEVSYKQIKNYMWYLRYKLKKNTFDSDNYTNNYLIVATTRPETIFGDVALAVNPQDSRYSKYIGKTVLIPLINRSIPIIADTQININKGTGCVKITPGHDFNDYTIGKKHGLPMINILSTDRKILTKPDVFDIQGNPHNQLVCHIPKIFHNLDLDQARKIVISECHKKNLLEDIKQHNSTVPYNNKTETIIEPILTDQWYIKTKQLSKNAINIVKTGKIKFIPEKHKDIYFQWMTNIQDWCISRQIWWGHRIPVWYDKNNTIYVGHCEKEIRLKYQLNHHIQLTQDSNVLDTWFSSSLWSFSSLGWPNNNTLLKMFHPTNVVISGFDIIFFWIARMIMMTMYCITDPCNNPQIPFKYIYITGLIRDEFGQKMSKSKGNIIDPLDIIDSIAKHDFLEQTQLTTTLKHLSPSKIIQKNTNKKQFLHGIKSYGADSLRLTLSSLTSFRKDIHWDINKLENYHNFCNKLWNAGEFVIMHTIDQNFNNIHHFETKQQIFSLSDRWIITKLHQTIFNTHQEFKNYRFDKIVNILYEFIWHQFCDWYIELTKPILFNNKNKIQLQNTRYTLITSFEIILRLIHPIVPFITEKIWQKIKLIIGIKTQTIMLQPYPTYNESMIDLDAITDLEWMKNIITEIRTIRIYLAISQNTPLNIAFHNISKHIQECVMNNYCILTKIVKIKNIDFSISSHNIHLNKCLQIPLKQHKSKLIIFLPDDFNKNSAIHKFNQKIQLINCKIDSIQKKLNIQNDNQHKKTFIIKEQEKLDSYNIMKDKLLNYYYIINQL